MTRLTQALARFLGIGQGMDGRVVAGLAVVAYLSTVALARLVWQADIWPWLGVPSGPSPFFDARNVTAALECHRLGYDPLVENPCDPWDRPMNYLRPWLLLGVLGLDLSDTVVFAVTSIVLFLVAIAVLVRRISVGAGILLAVALCSPAVMFAIERTNMDVLLFALLALAAILWRTAPRAAPVLSPLIVLVAATAKIYPVFALPAFLVVGSRRAAVAAVAALAAFGLYAVAFASDIARVMRIAPQGQHYSYGARILPAHLYHQLGPERWGVHPLVKQAVAALIVGLVGAGILLLVRRRPSRPAQQNRGVASAELVAFLLGCLVFLGTFAAGNNFDYRLVFVLLTLPQLFRWVEDGDGLGGMAAITVIAVLVLLWIGAFSEPLQLADELISWTVAGLFVVLLAGAIAPVAALRELTSNTAGRVPEGHWS